MVGRERKWNVKGILENDRIPEFQSGFIEIFDRYGKFIVSIDIESLGTGAVPVIAGITLGDVLLDVDVQQKLTTKWGVLKGRI